MRSGTLIPVADHRKSTHMLVRTVTRELSPFLKEQKCRMPLAYVVSFVSSEYKLLIVLLAAIPLGIRLGHIPFPIHSEEYVIAVDWRTSQLRCRLMWWLECR